MSESNYVQSNFLGGEVSPYAQGRIDLPSYRFAMNVCRNAHPIEEGCWLRRAGTRFGATTLNGAAGRVIKFDFEASAAYIMEFTNGFLRLYGVATQSGGLTTPLANDFRLVTTNDNQQVLDISATTPATVQTTTAHGWTTNDQVQFLFDTVTAANQTPLLCNRVFKITVTDVTHFKLTDPVTGLSIDGSALNWSAPVVGSVVVARIRAIVTPYTSGIWSTVRSVQAETEAVLLQGATAPQVLTVTALPTTSAFATFSLGAATFTDGPYLDPPTDGTTLTSSATSGTVTLTASAITAINGGVGFQAGDVNRLVRILSEPAAWVSGTATTYAVGASVKFNGTYFTAIQATTNNQPDVAIAYWGISTAPSTYTWSWAKITSITSTTVVHATIMGNALVNTNAAATWRLGVYSTTTGFPTCGVYYEGRIWFSGVIANRIDGSVVNGVNGTTIDMTPTLGDGTVTDANAISYIFNAKNVNPIFWMIATTSGIICGTLAAEWLVSAPTTGPITPTNIQAHPATDYGSANIDPVHCELTVAFVQRYNRKVLEYFPDVFSQRFTAPNLSKLAKHLTLPGIAEIRYQAELLPVIWARCNDGSLIGCTYKRSNLFSSQGPEFTGWHRHDLGSLRTVESITVGPSVDGTLDTLAMVTNDAATGVRHVELMTNLFDVEAALTSAWFVDDAVVPSGGTITQIAGVWTLTLNGLWHLNGKTVAVWCGAIDAGDYLVTNGSVAVPIDTDLVNPEALGTTALLAMSSTTAFGAMGCTIVKGAQTMTVPCVVGFTFTSQGQVLRPDTIEQAKTQKGPALGKLRRTDQFGVLLEGTQGISFGTDFSRLVTAKFKSAGGTVPLNKTQLFSGVYRDTAADTFTFDSMFCWQVSRPYPSSVVSIGPFFSTTDD